MEKIKNPMLKNPFFLFYESPESVARDKDLIKVNEALKNAKKPPIVPLENPDRPLQVEEHLKQIQPTQNTVSIDDDKLPVEDIKHNPVRVNKDASSKKKKGFFG